MKEKVLGLKCRECGRQYPKEPLHVCESALVPWRWITTTRQSKSRFHGNPLSKVPKASGVMPDLLPIDGEPTDGLNSGLTPLIRAKNLEAVLGVEGTLYQG